jgi:hypothetical protein
MQIVKYISSCFNNTTLKQLYAGFKRQDHLRDSGWDAKDDSIFHARPTASFGQAENAMEQGRKEGTS